MNSPDLRYPGDYRGPRAFDNPSIPRRQSLRDLGQFDPEDPRGWSADPPEIVRRLAPPGFKWGKLFTSSSEFTLERQGGILPLAQRIRWTQENRWRGRYPAIFKDENVTYSNNGAVFHVRRDKVDNEFLRVHPLHRIYSLNRFRRETLQDRVREDRDVYSTSFLKSAKPITYGYIEISCRLGDSALSSAFWLKEHEKSKREIDVFEYSTSKRQDVGTKPFANFFLTNIHVFSNPARGGDSTYHKGWAVDMQKDLSKEKVIKVGLLWTEEKLYWFLNDRIVRELNHNRIFRNCKMHIQLDREYLSWFGEPDQQDKMGEFHVYYVRTWQLRPTFSGRISRLFRNGGPKASPSAAFTKP